MSCRNFLLLFVLLPGLAAAAPPRIVWTTHTGDSADHGLALIDGTLYVGSARKITALDPEDGRILRFLLPPDGTRLTSRPVVLEGQLVVGDALGRLLTWGEDAVAKVRWTSRRGQGITALVSTEDRVLVGGDDGCVASLALDSVKRWSRCTAGRLDRALTQAADLVLAGDVTGRVSAWTAEKGAYRWIYDTDAALTGPPLEVGDQVILVGTDGHIYSLVRDRGVLRWRVHVGDRIHGVVASGQGLLVIATESRGLVAIDVKTGKAAWRASLPKTKASPAILDGLVVVGASNHKLYGFDMATGARRWRVSTPGVVLAAPVTREGRLFAVTEEGVSLGLQLR